MRLSAGVAGVGLSGFGKERNGGEGNRLIGRGHEVVLDAEADDAAIRRTAVMRMRPRLGAAVANPRRAEEGHRVQPHHMPNASTRTALIARRWAFPGRHWIDRRKRRRRRVEVEHAEFHVLVDRRGVERQRHSTPVNIKQAYAASCYPDLLKSSGNVFGGHLMVIGLVIGSIVVGEIDGVVRLNLAAGQPLQAK